MDSMLQALIARMLTPEPDHARIARDLVGIADLLIWRAKQTPGEHLTGYMNRYWLVAPEEAAALGLPFHGVRLHEILTHDHAKDLHNHPWSFRSYILKGGYQEALLMADGAVATLSVNRGSTYRRTHQDYHRIISISDQPVWTLCVLESYNVAGWGFLTESGHVDRGEYLKAS